MELNYKATPAFYSGFQKSKLLADPLLRKCILIYVGLAIINAPFSLLIPPSMKRETIFILSTLFYLFPMAISLAGGMSKPAWRWYAAFCALYLAGTIPAAYEIAPASMIVLPAAAYCLWRGHLLAPNIVAAFGYNARMQSLQKEIFAVAATTAVLVFYTYLGTIQIVHGHFFILPAWKYCFHIATAVLYYSIHWGILFGILMRRFLAKNFEPPAPIAVNVFLIFTYWLPSVLGYVEAGKAFVGVVGGAFSSQITLGLSYYFCRSTRPLIISYILFYLFIKTVVF